jgi:hypothetical protein
MSPSSLLPRTSDDHGVQKSSVSGSIDPLATANRKATEWKPTYMSDDTYEADHELDGSHSDMTAAERTADFLKSKADDSTAPKSQDQSTHPQLTLWPKDNYPMY